ncbi:phage antirepressor KilAC domain-containing protein [Marinobacterium lutimaris]|uniref:Phage antirepressor protein KilAC domain-containing protein n=1 Tax=Marinobacterium lutimaris TaxID=568106 RepID=A0A1H5XVR8_9GAMM|nr:phage antirepressor KilAC domain-containing protein [Marinobacterium lutimaris]SEG15864.1 Phage antirepressor protein KilAC domain-containing protein [Marinobacterium lutimaris]
MTTQHIHGLSMQAAARTLGTTRPQLFKFLREQKLLNKENIPSVRAQKSGWLTFDTRKFTNPVTGIPDEYAVPLVTGAGLIWLQEQFHPQDKDTEAA